jgi:hypothetical protein
MAEASRGTHRLCIHVDTHPEAAGAQPDIRCPGKNLDYELLVKLVPPMCNDIRISMFNGA